jgi:hypothetical protein
LVLSTLGAPERRRLARKKRQAPPEPEPVPVTTGRATIIDVGEPLAGLDQARSWLGGVGEDELAQGIEVLNRALHSFRLVTADPYLQPVGRDHALVTRVGFGAGEQVAEGQWTDARELIAGGARQGRVKVLQPQARLAAVLNGRERALLCEELALRARLDLEQGRHREAALQVLVALDAALAEMPAEPDSPSLEERLEELRSQRDAVAIAGQAALAGPLGEVELETVTFTLSRIEAALRARAVASA